MKRSQVPFAVLLAFAALACSGGEETGAPPAGVPAPGELEVTLPDLTRLPESERQRVVGLYEALQQSLGDGNAVPAELAAQYAELGKLFLAGGFAVAAAPCFRNAEALQPEEFAWPYFLGHVYRGEGNADLAIGFFLRALQLRPEEPAALIWLGNTYQEQGRTELARPLFERVLELPGESASALLGLGRAALAEERYEDAARHLERALELEPEATIIHYPLALAYRNVGRIEDATRHLELRGEIDVFPPDPWMEDVRTFLGNPMVYTDRGGNAYGEGNWEAAVRGFRKAVEVAPEESVAHSNLASALFRSGDMPGAIAEYEEALRLDPDNARALYGLGALAELAGADQAAADHYQQAIASDPRLAIAHLRLAHVLRRAGQLEDAVQGYGRVIEIEPRYAAAHLGRALALVRLARYTEARRRLEEAVAAMPDQPAFIHALARVLAASPVEGVRDGERALAMLAQLVQSGQHDPDLAETIAMALAETGDFAKAAEWQQQAVAAANEAGAEEAARRMEQRLAAYRDGRAWREPWSGDDPLHFPPRDAVPAQPQRGPFSG